ncbi:hypothetical protein D3C77_516010 [compost metagenome]
MFRVALQGDHVQRGDPGGEFEQVIGAGERQAGQAGHHRGAVHQRQGFLGPQHQRLPAQFAVYVSSAAALAAVHDFALARQGRGHVGQWRQVAAGTDRAFLGNQRQDVVGKKRLQALQQLDAHAGHTMAQRLQAGGQYGAGGWRIEQLAEAAAMEGVQVLGQGLDMLQWHRHHARVTVAGGHPVDHPFLVQQRVEELRATGNPRAVVAVVLQAGFGLAVGQGEDVFDCQRQRAEGHGLMRMHRHRSSRKGRN